MMYKPSDTIALARKLWKRMGIPFVFFSFLGWIIVEFVGKYLLLHSLTPGELLSFTFSTFFHMGFFPGNAALWFLLSLMIVRLVYNFVRRRGLSNVLLLGVSLILLVLAELFVEKFVILLPLLAGFTFYCLGNMNISKRFADNHKIYCVLLVLCVAFVLLTPGHSYLDFHAGKIIGEGTMLLPLFFVYGLAMILIVNWAGKKWLNHRIPVLTFVGQESMFLFATHYFLLLSTVPALKVLTHSSSPTILFVLTLLCLTAELAVLYIVFNTKHLRFLIGK